MHPAIESVSSVQIVDDPLAGDGIAHLHQSGAFFGLEEFDAFHVAIETKQIEQTVAIHLIRVESVENHHATLSWPGGVCLLWGREATK